MTSPSCGERRMKKWFFYMGGLLVWLVGLASADDRPNFLVFGIQTSRGIGAGPEGFGVRTVRDPRFRLIWNVNADQRFQNAVTKNFVPFASWKAAGEQGDAFAREQVERYQQRPELEFYDLQNDPYEMENLAGNPEWAAKIGSMHVQLKDWMKQQGDEGAATEAAANERKAKRRGH